MQKIPTELVGILFGDGSMCSYYYEIRISLGKSDKEYVKYVSGLFQQLGVQPKIETKKKTNEIWIRVYNKCLWTKFLEFFTPGKKKLIKFPRDWKSFLKGLFDTDGSIHIDKGKYPVISIRNNNSHILRILKIKIETIGISTGLYGPEITEFGGKVYKLRAYGIKNCQKWSKFIGSSNPRKNSMLMSCIKAIR